MLTIFEILKLTFPFKESDNIDALLEECISSDIREYHEKEWVEILPEDLSLINVQLRLVKTLYQLDFGYYGVAQSILQSLEDWGGESVAFESFDKETKIFAVNYYTLLSFNYFKFNNINRQVFLLGSRFLPLACLAEIPVIERVKEHFASFCDIFTTKNHILLFKTSLSNNQYSFIKKDNSTFTISSIIKDYEIFRKINKKDSEIDVEAFLNQNKDFVDVDDYNKNSIKDILYLYYFISSDKIWKEIEKSDCTHSKNTNQKKLGKKEVEIYLELLKNNKDISKWLIDSMQFVTWFKAMPNNSTYIRDILEILKEKIELEENKNIELLLKLNKELQTNKILKSDQDIVIFDESDNKFHWNINLSV